jgi:hypothetical protein
MARIARATLQDVAAMSLRPDWVMGLYGLFSGCYEEAAAAMQGYTGFDDPERRNVLPHFRRAVCEAKLRHWSLDHGLRATIEMTQRADGSGPAGHEFTLIRSGRLRLTVSKTDHPNALPDTAVFRKQHSRANDMLIQQNLFPAQPLPNPDKDKELIYAILTHGPAYRTDALGYLNIGFPRANFSDWCEPPVSMLEIQERQTRLYQKPQDMQADMEEQRRKAALKESARKKKKEDGKDTG